MRQCPNCARENADDANFCAACGAALQTERRQERKTVTVVFCDLVGFTGQAEQLDPEDVGALLSPYYARLRAELERFGGTVEKFIGDAVVAVFGAPVAHEDDPERALRAALAIRDWAIEDGQIEVRIAVNTGEALVSLGGDVTRGEGMVAGDVINTASRLQAAAPVNGVLAGEQTYRATHDTIDFKDSEPVAAKGKAEPIPVWEAVSARARVGSGASLHPRTDFVGRERELGLLRDTFARSRDQQEPQLVTLVGVPGAGKSRLVYELLRLVDEDPALVTWRQGTCLSYGEGVSFWALGEIVKAETGILESDRPDVAEGKLISTLAGLLPTEEAGWVAARLRLLVGLGEGAPAQNLRDDAFPAWRRFLEALAERGPTVLVVEDLHWADDGLLDFLDELAEWTSGLSLLLVCTARPDLLTRRPGWGGGKTNAVTLSLSPLSEAETAQIVHSLLVRTVLDDKVQRTLLERAGGNPLYAEEFARMILERGGADLDVPETVQGIIAARLDALEPTEKRLLQNAAVLGTAFWAGAVAALGEDGGDPHRTFRELERREFIRRERRSTVEGEEEYAFRHTLVRDVAYGQIPRAERSVKHQRAAEWIAALGRPDDHAELLAHHRVEALTYARAAGADVTDLVGPARVALTEAGDRAVRLWAYPQAMRFFESALELVDEGELAHAELLFRYGSAQHSWDTTGTDTLTRAVAALRGFDRRESAARAALMLAYGSWMGSDREGIDRWLAVVDELIADMPDSIVDLESRMMRSGLYMVSGVYDKAIALAMAAVPHLEQLDRPDLHARALDVIGTSRCSLGDEPGMEQQRHAIQIARDGRAFRQLHNAINNLTFALEGFGRLRETEMVLDEWAEVFDDLGAPPDTYSWYLVKRAKSDYAAGRWDEALNGLEQFNAIQAHRQQHYLYPESLFLSAVMIYPRGETSQPFADLDVAVTVAERSGDAQNVAPSRCIRASLLVAEGRPDEAQADFDSLLEIDDEIFVALNSNLGAADFAWLAVDLDRRSDVERILARSPFRRWADAGTAVLDGDAASAADILADIGQRASEAYTRMRAGGVHVQTALDFYRSVGATRYIRDCEALLVN